MYLLYTATEAGNELGVHHFRAKQGAKGNVFADVHDIYHLKLTRPT